MPRLTLRTLAYDWLQRKLGLMRCASFGALLSTAAYTGYSLVRRPAGFEWRFALFAASAACGTTGNDPPPRPLAGRTRRRSLLTLRTRHDPHERLRRALPLAPLLQGGEIRRDP